MKKASLKGFKRIFIAVLILGLVLGFSSGLPAKEVIKFGCAICFTGKNSRTGKLYVDSSKLAMVEGGGASGKIFSRKNPDIFGTLPAASQYFSSTLEMLAGFKPKPKKIAIIFGDDKFDIMVAKGVKKLAPKYGFDLVLYEKISESSADFNTILTKVKSLAPEPCSWRVIPSAASTWCSRRRNWM